MGKDSMQIQLLDDEDSVAREAAAIVALEARAAVAERGRFTVALSGGHRAGPGCIILGLTPPRCG
jgi:6-phosphogluconolactonase/glucosamine-6-phosphate isomerase/deaminase